MKLEGDNSIEIISFFLSLFNPVSQLHCVHTRNLNVAVESASFVPMSVTMTMTVKTTATNIIAVRVFPQAGSCDKGYFFLSHTLTDRIFPLKEV